MTSGATLHGLLGSESPRSRERLCELVIVKEAGSVPASIDLLRLRRNLRSAVLQDFLDDLPHPTRPADLARRLVVSHSLIRYHISQGHIVAERIDGAWEIDIDQSRAWIANQFERMAKRRRQAPTADRVPQRASEAQQSAAFEPATTPSPGSEMFGGDWQTACRAMVAAIADAAHGSRRDPRPARAAITKTRSIMLRAGFDHETSAQGIAAFTVLASGARDDEFHHWWELNMVPLIPLLEPSPTLSASILPVAFGPGAPIERTGAVGTNVVAIAVELVLDGLMSRLRATSRTDARSTFGRPSS